MLDTAIIGGGAAGLSAALYLGRFRRQVIIFDTQRQANRFSHAAHSFFTRDGAAPSDLIAIGREQLRKYETVRLQMSEVFRVTPEPHHFVLTLADGATYEARKLLLATGLKDTLPPIPGIEPFWGRSVFHCPYCDGWELHDQPVGIISSGESALHVTKLLRLLTRDLVICTNGEAEFNEPQRALLDALHVRMIETPIDHLAGREAQVEQIVFADGSSLARSGIFIRPTSTQQSPIAAQLGCAISENGLVQVDEFGHTSVSGVYAAGDMANRFRQLVGAAMQGAAAASGIIMDLIAEDFGVQAESIER